MLRLIPCWKRLLLLATAALAPPATSAATVVRLAPGTATHLLQSPRSLVTLVGRPVNIGALSYGYDFQRILANGSITGTCSDADSSGCFRVPAGNVLIITDISWAQDTDLPEGVLRIFELRASSAGEPARQLVGLPARLPGARQIGLRRGARACPRQVVPSGSGTGWVAFSSE